MNRKFACFHLLSLRITFGHPNPIVLFIFFHKKTIEPIRFHVAINSLLHTQVNARVFTCSNVA